MPHMGAQGPLVATLLQRRLRPSTLAQYDSNVRSFVRFLSAEDIAVSAVDHFVVARYIAWLWDSSDYNLAPSTLRSYIAAIRTVFELLSHRPVDTSHPIVRDLLTSYENDYADSHAPRPQRPAWPARATMTCSHDLHGWLHNNPNRISDTDATAAAHILFAALTYCRGNTSANATFDHVRTTPLSIRISLVTQKARRLRVDPPMRVLQATTLTHPIAVLSAFIARRRRLFGTSDGLFRLAGQRRASLTLTDAVLRTTARLGMDAIYTAHCLRIGAISAAHRIGVTLATIASHAGHANISTTVGYIRHGVPADSYSVVLYGSDRPMDMIQASSSLGVLV